MAKGKHPAPFRTRKLSLSAPMVLHGGPCGRLGRRRTFTPQGWPFVATPEVFFASVSADTGRGLRGIAAGNLQSVTGFAMRGLLGGSRPARGAPSIGRCGSTPAAGDVGGASTTAGR